MKPARLLGIALRLALAGSIFALSPGPRAGAAFAQTIQQSGGAQAVPVVPVVGAISAPLGPPAPAPALNGGLPTLPASIPLPQVNPAPVQARAGAAGGHGGASVSLSARAALPGASGGLAAPAVVSGLRARAATESPGPRRPGPGAVGSAAFRASEGASAGRQGGEALGTDEARPAAGEARQGARTSLEAVGRELSGGGSTSRRRSVLDAAFAGEARKAADAGGADVGAVQAPAGDLASSLSGRSGQAALLPAGGRAADRLAELEKTAADGSRPEAERRKAIEAIAKAGGAEAAQALKRVADANPEGGAADYEIHRAALRALAATGEVLSLRPVSKAHARELLAGLRGRKPELAVFDYDDTLERWKGRISPEAAAALAAAAAAGIRVHILTDRPDRPEREDDATILDSLLPMTPEQKARLSVQSSRGTRSLIFDRAGEAFLLNEEAAAWTEAEKAAIIGAAAEVERRYGRPGQGKVEEIGAYSYFRALPLGMPKEEVAAAARLMRDELKARGVDLEVQGRLAKNPERDPPYLTASKVDKSVGMRWILARRTFVERMQDAARLGLKGRWLGRLGGVLRRLPERRVDASRTLIVGDQFFDTRVTDRDMLKGAPGAMAISVGGKADPRLDNVFVWPSQGREGSVEVLGALAGREPSGMNVKAVLGLFAQRTISIGVFILTSIAYPFIAVPAVGWAGYGALMALGPVAAIATGPLNGLIADRLSARNAMVLNAAIRVVLNLALPAFAWLGVLNFWTLLIASFANGWLLSSVMTTENVYVKSLAGPKNVSTVNGLSWMNYLAVQVVLGLIAGVGSLIDSWNPSTAFLISAAAHAVLVAPILWFTMPNARPAAASHAGRAPAAAGGEAAPASARAAAARARTALAGGLRAAGRFLARHWLPAVLLAGAAALYAFSGPLIGALSAVVHVPAAAAALLKSTVPITASLMFWITRTDAFSGLWRGEGREASEAEKALEERASANRASTEAASAEVARLKSERPEGWAGRVAELESELAALAAEAKGLSKALRTSRTRLRSAMLYLALAALMLYPMQSFVLPLAAETLVGKAAKGLLLGQFTGALFFGNLISTSAMSRLPEVRVPFVGRVAGQRFIQAAVMGMAAAWFYASMVPGSALAAALAALAAAGLIALAGRLTRRGWVKLFGVGFGAVWLPFMAWAAPGLVPFLTVPMAMMIGLLVIGTFYGPGFVSLNSYFQTNARQGEMGKLVGAQGSLTNTAISIGYGVVSMLAASLSPALPALLAVLGGAYLAGTIAFWRAPARLPGLPPSIVETKGSSRNK